MLYSHKPCFSIITIAIFMKNASYKTSGICLLIGCFLMFITMVMHPTGGDIDHIMKIWVVAVASHAIAIASIPFLAVGFWGLERRLQEADFLSKLSLAIIFTGLVAVMIAAAINGLAYPIYAEIYKDASSETLAAIEPVTRFSFSLNHAMDYIFMGAVCASTMLWSLAIYQTKALPMWLGHIGMLLAIAAVVMWILGFVFVDLHGFRIFIFGWVIWVLLAGFLLQRTAEEKKA